MRKTPDKTVMQYTKKILTGHERLQYQHLQSQFVCLDEQAFLQEAKDFDTLDYEKQNKIFKFISIVDSSHRWMVMRVAELMKWIEGGEYDTIKK